MVGNGKLETFVKISLQNKNNFTSGEAASDNTEGRGWDGEKVLVLVEEQLWNKGMKTPHSPLQPLM